MALSEVLTFSAYAWFLWSICVTSTNSQYRDRQYFDDDYHHFDEPTNTQAQKAINPCHPSYHRVISNQPQRSYNYRLGSGSHRETALCDRDLTPGWYRFHSLAGNTIPTSCPGFNYCGTRAPVWMKGSIPSMDEGIVKATGCVSVQGKCCTTQIPMLIRNCSDFIVYHLQPTPACPSAYCAGYEVPCPGGLSSDNGYTPCHFPVDLLETKVSHGLSKDGTQVQFFCDVTLGGHVVPESVALEVEWLADDETIQSETFGLREQYKGVLKENKWSVGQTLQCRARAKHTTINTFTSIVTSPPFNTGVSTLNSSPIITINEGAADPGYIEFTTNIPITCPKKKKTAKEKKAEKKEEEEEAEECCLTFEISTRGANTPRCADGSLFDLVLLNTCSHKVCADEWNITHRIPVWAVNDGLVGGGEEFGESGYSSVYIDIRTVEPSPPRWVDLNLPQQEIHITHGDVQERCVADEYVSTFDGLSYYNQLEGTFVLYRHASLPYEVQVHLKKCNQRPLCNCAVAIRFGDVMLGADICSTGKLKFSSFTSDGSAVDTAKTPHFPQIIRVDEGRSFQIQFPTGTRVNLGPNLRFISIQASLSDLEQTGGLCGSFDRDPSNDFATFKGQVVCSSNVNITAPCDDFSKSWRLLTDQSLFVGSFNNEDLPAYDEEEDTHSPGQCSCSTLKKPAVTELRPKQKSKFSSYPYEDYQPEEPTEEEGADKNKCSSTRCVDPRGMDVSHQLLELLQDDDFAAESEDFGKLSSEPAELKPVFFGDSFSPLAKQTLKKNWTEDEAEIFCLHMIEGVTTTKLCRDIAHVNVDVHTKACKSDILHTKAPSWSVDALEQLRWECRDQVYHNLSIWEPQLGRQHGTPPQAVLSSLCLNNCTGLGPCENGQCRCQRGFAGSDCSVNIKQAPRITSIHHNGICDIRNKPCSEILVWGDRFAEYSSLRCHFDIYRSTSVKTIPVLSATVTTNARLLTYQSIICDVPDLQIHDAKIASFYIPGEGLDKTRALTRVRVSYGTESPPSEALDYTIFDSLCWFCESPLGCEARPTQSCNVLSEPFGSSSDPFQNNPSYNSPSFVQSNSPLQYSPDSSGGFTPPAIPQSHSLPGFSLSAQLHPQLSSPCALTKDTGPCRNDIIRYFYDGVSRKCRPFIYGGCQGNANNFLSEDDCLSSCGRTEQFNPSNAQQPTSLSSEQLDRFLNTTMIDPIDQIPLKCAEDINPGPCQEEIVRYYFDTIMRKCRPFIYGGCGGSLNNFLTKESCLQECAVGVLAST